MGKESTLILHAGYIGFYMLFVYDLFRIFRGIVRHKGWMVALEDYFYCAYFFVTVFLFLNREGNGTLRWFAVAGALVGMILYKKLLGRRLVGFGISVLTHVKIFILKLVEPPIKTTVKITRNIFRRIKRGVNKRLTILRKILKMSLGAGRKKKQRDRKEDHGKKKGGIPKESTE